MKTTTHQIKPAEKETAEQIRVKPYKEILEYTNSIKLMSEFDDNDNLILHYNFRGEGSLLSDKMNSLMLDYHPDKSYSLKMLAKEQILKIRIEK